MHPLVIDCDTGRDDALALWLALNLGLPLAAVITSYGNTVLENATRNTIGVLSFAGREDIPIIAGYSAPTHPHRLFQDVVLTRQKASGNGLCDIEFSENPKVKVASKASQQLAEALLSLARQRGPIDYLIMGPATNFAAATKALGQKVLDVIGTVAMMGGKFDPMWSDSPTPDFNIASDPYAVSQILEAGINLRLLPINSTWPIALTLDEVEALESSTPLAIKAKELMIAHCRRFAPEPVFRFHDPSLILTVQNPQHFVPKRLKIVLDEDSVDFGRLIESGNGTVCHIHRLANQVQDSYKNRILNGLGLLPSGGDRSG